MARYAGVCLIVLTVGVLVASQLVAQQPGAGDSVLRELARVGQEIRLGPGRPVVVPDTTPDSEWLERVGQLGFDADRRRVLVLNQGSSGVVEFTLEGRFIQRFSRGAGAGPGEIGRAARFAFNEDILVILDHGNGKLVVFGRRDGSYRRDRTLPRRYSDLTLAPSGDVAYLVPGAPGHAVDVLDLASGAVESRGSLADLPLSCDRADCTPRRELCRGCRIQAVGDSLLVVLNRDVATLVTFDLEGTARARLPFSEVHPLLRRWREEDEPLLREARAADGPNALTLKVYFTDIGVALDGRVVVPVVPSRRQWERRGNELWLVDPITGRHSRYVYPRRQVGFWAVFTGREVIAFDADDDGVHLFPVPVRDGRPPGGARGP